MKKNIYFLILFIPWIFTIFIFSFNKTVNNLLILFLCLSLIYYFFITLYLYMLINENKCTKDIILGFILLYIFNQSFNISIFYYKNYYLSFIISFFQIFSYLYINIKQLKNT